MTIVPPTWKVAHALIVVILPALQDELHHCLQVGCEVKVIPPTRSILHRAMPQQLMLHAITSSPQQNNAYHTSAGKKKVGRALTGPKGHHASEAW
jgi:hypothetical protein